MLGCPPLVQITNRGGRCSCHGVKRGTKIPRHALWLWCFSSSSPFWTQEGLPAPYTAAISSFHDLVGGLSVGKHPVVSQFLKGANRLHPGPSWDLPLVLRSLTKAPYEPLEQSISSFSHTKLRSSWPCSLLRE